MKAPSGLFRIAVDPVNRSHARQRPVRSMPTANYSRWVDATWTGAEITSCCNLASLSPSPKQRT